MNTVTEPAFATPRADALPGGQTLGLMPSRFEALQQAFFSRVMPSPMAAPHWVAVNLPLARELGLPDSWLEGPDSLSFLSGNAVAPGSQPLASVYSGHQFGVWAGQLGDGRALLLGDCMAPSGERFEVQLKGAGLTPYSRMGDGRAVLRSSIREYLCSEAMHGLGIPTTRALALVGSPTPVQRETQETAAVVTRVAPSFIRFGHFEHFAANGQIEDLRTLADFVVEHYWPHLRDRSAGQVGNVYAALLAETCRRTARLLAQWQAVGFCHGVMNTDNMSILGLTIDYGPFGFLDGFDANHVCNHSDHQGRYAYARQPNVAFWNLFCLGQALMPLIDDQDAALAALEPYKTLFPAALDEQMAAKFGLRQLRDGDRTIFEGLLQLMNRERTDYTITFRRLCDFGLGPTQRAAVRDLFRDREAFDAWAAQYDTRLAQEPASPEERAAGMRLANPRFVLRNHLAQQAIDAANQGDFSEVHRLHAVLARPFDEQPEQSALADFPPDWAGALEVSCFS
jgi:uncharacterized protein YdiU (UPF0061 family)